MKWQYEITDDTSKWMKALIYTKRVAGILLVISITTFVVLMFYAIRTMQ